MNYISLRTTISEVMGAMGLVVPSSNLFTSSDGTVRQMRQLLSDVLDELVDKYDFQSLITSYGFTTTTELAYDLPSDYKSFIPNTFWREDSQWPLCGPLDPIRFRAYKTGQIGINTLSSPFTIQGDQIVFVQSPGEGVDIVVDYISTAYILGLDTDTNTYITPITAFASENDLIRLPKNMVKQALRTRWRENKGFDTNKDEQRLRAAISAAKHNDSPRNEVYLTKSNYQGMNVPDTGFGTS